MPRTPYIILALAIALGLFLGCSDPKDRPEDCTSTEFFDEVDELCESCPALVVPSECDKAIVITKNDVGCPKAECAPCPNQGEAFQSETLSCEMVTCAEGWMFNTESERCEKSDS